MHIEKLNTNSALGKFPLEFSKLPNAQSLTNQKPFLLSEPDTIWLVVKGQVEVFIVKTLDNQPVGVREFVFSRQSGQALFGMDATGNNQGLGFLVVLEADTELIKFKPEWNEGVAKELALLAYEWFEDLSNYLIKPLSHKPFELGLHPNENLEIKAGQIATPASKGQWLKIPEKREILFLSRVKIPATPGFFPLPFGSWVEAQEPVEIETIPLDMVISVADFWDGLNRFYGCFWGVKQAGLAALRQEELKILKDTTRFEQTLGKTALFQLASVMGVKREAEITEPKKDWLLEACRLVGQAQGIVITDPPHPEEETFSAQRRNRLSEISRSSRFRTRTVSLEGEWWKKENGPLLAFAQTPVALLPTSQHSYEMVDPFNNSRQFVTAEIAAQLSPNAFIFYRPLPYNALKAWDLLKYGLRGNRRDLIKVALVSLGGGLLGLGVPVATGLIIDSIIPAAALTPLFQLLFGLIIFALSAACFQITRSIATLRVETRLENSLQLALFDRLLGLDLSFFRKYTAGDIAMRVGGISVIHNLLSNSVITLVLGMVTSLFSFILIFSYSLPLALMALGLTVITLVITSGFIMLQLPYNRAQVAVQGSLSGLVLQLITGIAKLRVAGAELRAFNLWAGEFSQQRKLSFKVRVINSCLIVFNTVWPVVILLITFIQVANSKNLSVGTFLAFQASFSQFLTATLGLTTAFTSMLQVIPTYERLKPIFQTLPEDFNAKVHPGQLKGAIRLKRVTFRYGDDGPEVLKDVSLEIKPGQFVAIVGASGSGKSSLIRLLLGFEKPTAGAIYYDDQNLANLDLREVRAQMGVVLQNARMLSNDIYHHIVGSLPYNEQDAWEAARLAGVDGDISSMPMGMFTQIAEGGTTLSVGQRQRLMIAKAVISRPPILLLDEATSALDNKIQSVVNDSLGSLKTTRLVVAHRLSTIINADCIYVLKAGKIVQSGTFDELLNQPGTFQELALRQVA